MKTTVIILLLIVLILLISPFLINREIYSPEVLRKESQSTSFKLQHGETEYESIGSSDTALFFIHGFSIPMFIWDYQVEYFRNRGWQIIRYSHYGRGLSDYPDINYDRNDLRIQAEELLDSLKVKKVIVFGHSLGGPIASDLAIANPDRVAKVVLVDPILSVKNGGTAIARMPLISAWLNRLIVGRIVEKRANHLLTLSDIPADSPYRKILRRQVETKGFHKALQSMLRNDALDDYGSGYKKLGLLQIPTLILYGQHEKNSPAANMDTIISSIPSASYQFFPDASHVVHLDSPDSVNKAIYNFITAEEKSNLLK